MVLIIGVMGGNNGYFNHNTGIVMTGLKCSNCGTENEPGQLICIKCDNLLFNPSISTVHMRIDPALLRLRRTNTQDNSIEAPENTVLLTVRGMSERLIFEEGTEIILGRADPAQPNIERLDLSR